MTAKEMFKKLGFEDYSIAFKKDEIQSIHYTKKNGTWLDITKENIQYVEECNKAYLPTKLLKAINKQVEELGWDND